MSYQYMYYLCYCGIHLLMFISCYCTSIYKIYIILLCFICNHHWNFLISQIPNKLLCDIFKHIFWCRQVNLLRSKGFDRTRTENIKRILHKVDIERWIPNEGSDDSSEGDRDSDLNHLASVVLRQYTTVTNKCQQFPWTWMWRIHYYDRWYHSKKRLVRV